MKKIVLFSVNAVCFAVILTPVCYAYIDPATTSYLIQIIAGIVIACGAAIGIFWNKITRFFRKKKGDSPAAPRQNNKKTSGDDNIVRAEDLLDDDESEK